ncbi:MAG: DUF2442 domain-containing protein [Planctomycetota bacterium]
MDKAHIVQGVTVEGTILKMTVDGRACEFDLSRVSKRLAQATAAQRVRFEVAPSGYGIHWPEVDEDLSIDGLLGVKHHPPVAAVRR